MIADRIASVITDRTAPAKARRLAHDWMLELLARPFAASEAAEKLGVSKPTAIKWLRAGLVRRADHTSEEQNLFDAASVLSTREVLQQLKMKGTVVERAQLVADLPERLFWTANRDAFASLETSLREADRGRLAPVGDDELQRGRELLEKRRALGRRRAARRRRRNASGRAT